MLDLTPPPKLVPLNHTKKLGNIEFMGYLKSHTETAHLIFSIQKYLENSPSFYLSSLLGELKGLTLETIKPRLEKEYNSLVECKSFLHLMNNAIQSRRRCLNKIRRDITKSNKFLTLFPQEYFRSTQDDVAFIDWVEAEGYTVVDVDESVEESIKAISNIFMDMARLRDMTIYLVEQLHNWRVRIEEHLDRCQQHSEIKFYFENENAYESLLEDSSFIWSSKLSQYIWMQAKQDPFFIRNVILVDQRATKTLLEKYFVELVYPKNQQNIDKAVRCFEMLTYKFKPKLYNRFEEEELLIQNYLKMEMDSHQFDQSEEGLKISRLPPSSPEDQKIKTSKKHEQSPSKQTNKLNPRGWVFEKQLKSPHRQRMNEIIQTHKGKMGLIKPYNISNYAEKNSIALAYLSEVKNSNDKKETMRRRKISFKSVKEEKHFMSEGQEKRRTLSSERGIESEPQRQEKRGLSESKMFRSLTKLNPIIQEDPKEHLPDSPNAKDQKNLQNSNPFESDRSIVYGKQASLQHAKINSFLNENYQKDKITKIEIEEQETPLNLSTFYEVFRADTNKPLKSRQGLESSRRVQQKEGKDQKLLKIKQFIEKVRKERSERAKSMHLPYTRKVRVSLPKAKRKDKSKSIEKSLSKSRDSYKEFQKIQPEASELPTNSNDWKKIFLGLKAKSIPIDLVTAYVKHLQNILPEKSRIFSNFDTKFLIQKLSDPAVHSIIFDVSTDNHISVGTMVLSQTLGGRGGRLKYQMQFMSIQPFELVSVAMLRVAEELLSATPCQEVVYPLIVDRLDLVSSHFIDIIDADLIKGVQKFGKLVIMERSRPSLTGTDVRERIYVFTAVSNHQKLYGPKLQMMGNYRSLKILCKCLVLTSNFRLRSENLFKETLHKYLKVAIGELFARAFMKIMTKYHLKLLRQASFGGEGELGQVVRRDSFLRSILYASVQDFKGVDEEMLKTTLFSNMDDLLNYLRYKKHDQYFHFQFLAESRFILQHQLVLVELDQQLSLEFTLTSNQQLYILHNHRQHQLIELQSAKINASAYLIPTTDSNISLFIMPASDYVESTIDRIDLYSYLSYFFRSLNSERFLNDVPSIVLPNLHKQSRRVNKVRMFDGFFRLFPEREFYSAAAISCINHWQSYYTDAVIHQPLQKSLILQYPFIMGFYNNQDKILLSGFLYLKESEISP